MPPEIDVPDEGGCDCPDCIAERAGASGSIYSNPGVEDFLIRTGRVSIVGKIDEIMSAHVCDRLQMLSVIKEPIYIYINSPGGCLSAGYAIIDQMSISQCPIYTIVRGQAHSMGAIIAAFGNKGCRYAMPNSSIMLHDMIIQDSPGSICQYKEMIAYSERDFRRKMKELAKRLKLSTKQLMDLLEKTKWMSPKQAIEIGLIDGIWNKRLERTANKGS